MFTAWSPIRSRSALIFMAEVMSRRSAAMGGWSGEELQAAVVDLDLEVVDLAVAGDDLLGQLRPALDEGVHRLVDALLHQRAHARAGGS